MNELSLQKAQRIASVCRNDVLVGIRPNGKGFFACLNNNTLFVKDRMERDGSTIDEAVDALYDYVIETYQGHLTRHTSGIQEATEILSQLEIQ